MDENEKKIAWSIEIGFYPGILLGLDHILKRIKQLMCLSTVCRFSVNSFNNAARCRDTIPYDRPVYRSILDDMRKYQCLQKADTMAYIDAWKTELQQYNT